MTGGEAPAIAAALVASAGAGAWLSRPARVHALGIPLLLVGWVGLLAAIAPSTARDRWLVLAVAGLLVAGGCWLAAGALAGRERWILAAGAAVLTLRVPIPTGDGVAMLLAPLYAVVAIAAVTLMRSRLPLLRSSGRHPRPPGSPLGLPSRLVDVAIASFTSLAVLSIAWSHAPAESARSLAFFLVPFLLAYVVVRTWAASGIGLGPAAWSLLGAAVAAASVGLVQAATYQVWWNPKVVEANRFRPDFRANSLFWDPNIYGRALVVSLLLLVALLLAARLGRRRTTAAAVLIGVLGVALWHTWSQSSWVALGASLGVLGVLTLPPRPRRWAAVAIAVVVLAGVPLALDQLAGPDARGRAQVVRTGLSLASNRPVAGWGIGAFEAAARARAFEDRRPDGLDLTASHTTPVTVLAELGALGAVTYLALLGFAATAVLARWRLASSTVAGWPEAPVIWSTGVLVALGAHSLLYAGFFEDATLWVALALVAGVPARLEATSVART